MNSILEFFKFASALIDFFKWAQATFTQTPAEAIAEVHAVMAVVAEAKTPEEKVNAAAKLQALLSRS